RGAGVRGGILPRVGHLRRAGRARGDGGRVVDVYPRVGPHPSQRPGRLPRYSRPKPPVAAQAGLTGQPGQGRVVFRRAAEAQAERENRENRENRKNRKKWNRRPTPEWKNKPACYHQPFRGTTFRPESGRRPRRVKDHPAPTRRMLLLNAAANGL